MNYLDILNEIEEKGRLRNVLVGGYAVKRIKKPGIFTNEVVKEGCKFVDFKVIYVSNNRGRRLLSAGNVAAFVPNDLRENDFYELRGTLSLGSTEEQNYTRLVTLMNFKVVDNGNKEKRQWEVHPAVVNDIELTKLSNRLYEEVMNFSEAPLSYHCSDLDFILKPVSELSNSDKVRYNFKGKEKVWSLRKVPNKKTKDFEEEYNYLIDRDYEIIREALRYPILAVNLSDFGHDKMLLKYMEWLVNGDIEIVESISSTAKNKGYYIVLTGEDIDGIPYLELKRGALM